MNAQPKASTPGPWEVIQDSAGTLDVNKQQDGIRSRIARLHVEHLADEHDGSIEANARLIAAAPALLEACKAMVEWDDSHEGDVQPSQLIEQARAAIAQAEGRAK